MGRHAAARAARRVLGPAATDTAGRTGALTGGRRSVCPPFVKGCCQGGGAGRGHRARRHTASGKRVMEVPSRQALACPDLRTDFVPWSIQAVKKASQHRSHVRADRCELSEKMESLFTVEALRGTFQSSTLSGSPVRKSRVGAGGGARDPMRRRSGRGVYSSGLVRGHPGSRPAGPPSASGACAGEGPPAVSGDRGRRGPVVCERGRRPRSSVSRRGRLAPGTRRRVPVPGDVSRGCAGPADI